MSEEITDPNDCIVKVGGVTSNDTTGVLVIDDFEFTYSQDKERKYGIGNPHAQGRTNGNIEIDLSFTTIGENPDLFREVAAGDFTVALTGNDYIWRLGGVEDTEFSVSITDGGDYEFSFDGNALWLYSNEI